jgi:uncharacterized protein (TIGR02996 family)
LVLLTGLSLSHTGIAAGPLSVTFGHPRAFGGSMNATRGGYHTTMQYDDDTAFRRAILANPADTALKLVYADWLQEHDDPRAEFVRLQVELHTTKTSSAAVDAAAWFLRMGDRLDADWVKFMRKAFPKS